MSEQMTLPKDVTAEMTCGACPVQIEGEFGGKGFYFRARYDRWRFAVGSNADDAVDVFMESKEGWMRGDSYDDGTGYGASYMPHKEAWEIVNRCIGEYGVEV